MFKSLRVVAVLLAFLIVIIHGQNDSDQNTGGGTNNNSDSTTASSIVDDLFTILGQTTESPSGDDTNNNSDPTTASSIVDDIINILGQTTESSTDDNNDNTNDQTTEPSTADNNNNTNDQTTEPSTADDQTTTEETTAMSTTESSVATQISNEGLLEGILDALVNSPLGLIFRPLSLILRPIFWIVDTLLEPVFLIVRVVLSLVVELLELLTLPIRGLVSLLNGIGDIVQDTLSSSGRLISLVISNISGISSVLLSEAATQPRNRRGIMDTMIGMAWTTLMQPFRIVYDIISTFFLPFYYLYNIVTWPLHFIFGGNYNSDITTDIATVANYLPFTDMISALVHKLSNSSQDAIIELLKFAWARTKDYLLPAIDEIIVWADDSQYVPTDIKTGLSSLHSAYSVLHMFGIL